MSQKTSPMMFQPGLAALGGNGQNGQPAWYRLPFFPTSPYYSTNPNVGYMVRYYRVSVLSTDSGVTVGSATQRTITFSLPTRVIAINGSCVNTAQNGALPIGVDPRDCFLLQVEHSSGDKLHINSALGSTVCGTAQNPGELGAVGYAVDQGQSLLVNVTPINPIPENFRINITFHCLELRGSSNMVGGQ